MATPETFRALLAANAIPQRVETASRTKYLCSKSNQFLYKLAHEPSLAGHRIQEHVQKTVPNLVRNTRQVENLTKDIKGTIFDLECTSNVMNQLEESMQHSTETREIISELASKVSAYSSKESTKALTRASSRSQTEPN